MKLLSDRDWKRQQMLVEELARQVNQLKENFLKVCAERDKYKERCGL